MDHPVQAKRRHADTARHVLQGDIGKKKESSPLPRQYHSDVKPPEVISMFLKMPRAFSVNGASTKPTFSEGADVDASGFSKNVHVRISVDIAGEYKLLKADNVHIVVIVKSRRAGNRIILIRIYNAKSHLSGIGNTLQIDSERFETRRDIIIVDSVRNTEFAVLYISADFNVCLFLSPSLQPTDNAWCHRNR